MSDAKIKEIEKRLDKLEEKPKDWSDQKVAYFSSLRSAWHANRQSQNKSMLSLSAAGIGLLVGLSNFLLFSSITQMVFFGCSILFFGITIIFAFLIWDNNAKLIDLLIKKCIAGPSKKETFECKICKCNLILSILDWFLYISFLIAIATAITFASLSMYSKYNNNNKQGATKHVRRTKKESTATAAKKTGTSKAATKKARRFIKRSN